VSLLESVASTASGRTPSPTIDARGSDEAVRRNSVNFTRFDR
jgi:hypothetical protein